MNNEIKESINRIQSIVDFYKLNDENNYDYSDDVLISMKILLDYITNLQEENERLKEYRESYRKELDFWRIQFSNKEERIDKAIEYIEWNLKTNEEVLEYFNFDGNFNRLLSILRGEE